MSSHTDINLPIDLPWNLDRATEFYSIHDWGEGYFDVNTDGHIVAKPDANTSIDLVEVSEMIKQQGLSLPVLVRFPQILQSRIKQIDAAFNNAAISQASTIKHTQCYPIKVNQQRTVIEHVLACDIERIGLEVGSKTELIVALGMQDRRQIKLICNGYKDRAYIRIALYAQSMGLDVFIVIENPSELEIIRQECECLNVTPKLGLRIKLNSVAEGIWQNSGGNDAKFGLAATDILYCLQQLEAFNGKSWLQLIHFHMGSQISRLNEFKHGLQEALVVYSEIISAGFNLKYLDVGGGLAVDYASQHDTSYFSRGYTIQQYADTIVATIIGYCQQNNLAIPMVLTENGRAITAHHAMLITNVVKASDKDEADQTHIETCQDQGELYQLGKQLQNSLRENTIDIIELKERFEHELQKNILQGSVNLKQRAWAENIIQQCQFHEQLISQPMADNVSSKIEKYYCNFSVFQSMPDVWGLQQIFPITPLSRLDERPNKQAQLQDLTCDSDGLVSSYAFDKAIHSYINLHELSNQDEYLIGFFLLGAYQEVLGDMHNLFGDTHAVNVVYNDQAQLEFTELEKGDCVNELLASIHVQGEHILNTCKGLLSKVNTTNVTSEEILEEINNALYGYTYLDSLDRPSHKIK